MRLTPKEREAALLIAKHYLDLNRTLVSGGEVLLVMRALRDAENTASETKRTVKYVRMPIYDKRIGNGDDYAGDAWVRWTAVGQIPEDLDASTSTVR